jgi:predicted 3-demethylubiquinone-9 3-methyltransferase (glyoxalase superfamily)
MKYKITPNLWFAGNAQEAAEFYAAAFPGSRILSKIYYPKRAEEGLAEFQADFAGKVLTIDFELGQHAFTAINAGPDFKFNPSISYMVNFDTSKDDQAQEHLKERWQILGDGGQVLMPLGPFPHSKLYGWVADRYGLTWQLILSDPAGDPRPFIIPSLLFTGENLNHAEEAVYYYVSIFDDAKIGALSKYPEDHSPAKAGALMYSDFTLANQWFAAMDSAVEQDFAFNEAISLSVSCKDQAEIDYFWEKLSSDPQFEQCGWCKDKFGVSWQIVPENIEELMGKPNAYAHMMDMKKLVIADF